MLPESRFRLATIVDITFDSFSNELQDTSQTTIISNKNRRSSDALCGTIPGFIHAVIATLPNQNRVVNVCAERIFYRGQIGSGTVCGELYATS